MTEEELDLIASAYVDGEATPEEVAMVERDPDLAVRVEEIRALSQQLSAPVSVPTPAMKEQHLAAALGEFSAFAEPTAERSDSAPAPPTVKVDRDSLVDRQGPGAEPAPTQRGNVIDLAGRPKSGRSDSETQKTFPRWLSAAAALVVIGGGAVFLAGQVGNSDDDTSEAATADFAADDAEEITESADEDASRVRDEVEQDTLAAASAEEAMEEGGDAMDDSAMEDEEAADADAAGSGEAAPTTAAPVPTEVEEEESEDAEADSSGGGFFPNEPVMVFEKLPETEQALAEMPDRRDDLFRAACNDQVPVPAGSKIVAFLPIEVAGEPAELFVIEAGDGTETGVILDATCSTM